MAKDDDHVLNDLIATFATAFSSWGDGDPHLDNATIPGRLEFTASQNKSITTKGVIKKALLSSISISLLFQMKS